MLQSLVEVYAAANIPQAHLVKAALADEGIEAQIVGENLQGAMGELPLGWSSLPRVLVEHSDAARAREIVAGWETVCASDTPSPDKPPWTCSACGAEVEGNFDICWNCQHSRVTESSTS